MSIIVGNKKSRARNSTTFFFQHLLGTRINIIKTSRLLNNGTLLFYDKTLIVIP
jgi:hypothetical protein